MAFKASVITAEGCCDQPKQSYVIIMENSDLLWFLSCMRHLKTHVIQSAVVSVSLESKKFVSAALKTVASEYIFKVMMTIFK